MKKILFGLIAICVAVISGIIVYENRDSIATYLSNKEWEIVESVGTAQVANFFAIDGTSSNLIVVGNNYINGYLSNSKENFDESVSLKSAITDAEGDYCIIGEKDGTKVYMISASTKVWESDIQGSILDVSVNKNGYSAIIYKQTGYKSLIKVMNPDGSEIFTSYSAYTYAIDAEISNDNKSLAVAKINADGIKAESSIELIDVNNVQQENVKKISLDNDVLVTDIEYNDKNELLVLTDKGANIIVNGVLDDLGNDFENSVSFATIENSNNMISVSKRENGLFDVDYVLNIYEYAETAIKNHQYELSELPLIVTAQNKNIALLLENEFIVVNTNGKLVRRCEISGNIKTIQFFDNGNAVALVFRDKIEFLKI